MQPGNSPVELKLGLAHYKIGQAEMAAATLETVHQAAPDQLQPSLLLADCWLTMGMNLQALPGRDRRAMTAVIWALKGPRAPLRTPLDRLAESSS